MALSAVPLRWTDVVIWRPRKAGAVIPERGAGELQLCSFGCPSDGRGQRLRRCFAPDMDAPVCANRATSLGHRLPNCRDTRPGNGTTCAYRGRDAPTAGERRNDRVWLAIEACRNRMRI